MRKYTPTLPPFRQYADDHAIQYGEDDYENLSPIEQDQIISEYQEKWNNSPENWKHCQQSEDWEDMM
jgi:hypothetical protein